MAIHRRLSLRVAALDSACHAGGHAALATAPSAIKFRAQSLRLPSGAGRWKELRSLLPRVELTSQLDRLVEPPPEKRNKNPAVHITQSESLVMQQDSRPASLNPPIRLLGAFGDTLCRSLYSWNSSYWRQRARGA